MKSSFLIIYLQILIKVLKVTMLLLYHEGFSNTIVFDMLNCRNDKNIVIIIYENKNKVVVFNE
ncbi:hypothetical protein ABD87_14920 [Lysinibacillus sphaericus]|nr:hypothetical protein [Lysinibacillus sphaericus]